MASQTELATAIADLCGIRFVNVGRTLNMVEVGFMRGDDEVRLHVQCPFRLVRHSKVVLGSTDYLYPLKAHSDRALAFDRYETQFDRRAKILTEKCSVTVCRCVRRTFVTTARSTWPPPTNCGSRCFPQCRGRSNAGDC